MSNGSAVATFEEANGSQTAVAMEHVAEIGSGAAPENFDLDTSGVDAGEPIDAGEPEQLNPEAAEGLIGAINEAIGLVGLKLDFTKSRDAILAILAMSRDEIESVSQWVDDVLAESSEASAEERNPVWPLIPAALVGLVATQKPKAETREQAVVRLQELMCARLEALQKAKVSHSMKAEEAKTAKKAMEAAQDALNGVVTTLQHALHGQWQPALPFADDMDGPDNETGNTAENHAESSQTVSGKDPAIEAPVSELGLTSSITGKLEAGDIETVKELETVMAQDRLRKVAGIGQSAIDKISDAVIDWRKKYGYGSDADES